MGGRPDNPFDVRDATLPLDGAKQPAGVVRRFRLTVLEGPKAGTTWQSQADRCSIGFHESNDLVIEDPTVSRFHCEVKIDAEGARVRDLESRNRTVVDGVTVFEALLRDGSLLKLGRDAASAVTVDAPLRRRKARATGAAEPEIKDPFAR